MDFQELWRILEKEISNRITKHKGLNFFIKNRSKFEGWFKIEVCDILSEYTDNITPEKDRIDIVFDDWALELKTSNTNYNYKGIEKKNKPITKNINSILKDIRDLKRNKDYKNKAVIFIIFPLCLSVHKECWEIHIKKIKSELDIVKEKKLIFNNGFSGVLYCGLVC
jgi:hypothetical protein